MGKVGGRKLEIKDRRQGDSDRVLEEKVFNYALTLTFGRKIDFSCFRQNRTGNYANSLEKSHLSCLKTKTQKFIYLFLPIRQSSC